MQHEAKVTKAKRYMRDGKPVMIVEVLIPVEAKLDILTDPSDGWGYDTIKAKNLKTGDTILLD